MVAASKVFPADLAGAGAFPAAAAARIWVPLVDTTVRAAERPTHRCVGARERKESMASLHACVVRQHACVVHHHACR